MCNDNRIQSSESKFKFVYVWAHRQMIVSDHWKCVWLALISIGSEVHQNQTWWLLRGWWPLRIQRFHGKIFSSQKKKKKKEKKKKKINTMPHHFSLNFKQYQPFQKVNKNAYWLFRENGKCPNMALIKRHIHLFIHSLQRNIILMQAKLKSAN